MYILLFAYLDCHHNLTITKYLFNKNMYCVGRLCLAGFECYRGNVYVDEIPVCDHNWDLKDAHVVCKQLGFQRAASATTGSRYDLRVFNFVKLNIKL